ncbi:MAG: tRNA threonylcarbamoyladenosine dehydratase [Clostridia bacterium]|nr:tRNA threonylcarbamoyladenosine dehydratase [Clostridia bacterium]
MEKWIDRSAKLYGEKGVENLKNASVLVFGAGGVGSYAIEALARSGIGSITVVDGDEYSLTNINRQLYATLDTLGKKKVDVCAKRIKSINPDCKAIAIDKFVLEEDISALDFSPYSFVIDAIDTVSAKLAIILKAKAQNVPVISCMGTGNKKDPTLFKVEDIYKTKVCPLCKVMRKLLKDKGVENLTVVYSEEEPIKRGDRTPASNSFTPAVAGLILAGHVINNLVGENDCD